MKILAFSIPVILILLSRLKKESKTVAVILCLYVWAIFSFNTNNGDYWTYNTIYNAVRNGNLRWHFEPLFSVFMQACAFAGMDFFGFRAMLGLMSVLLLRKLFCSYSKAPAMAMSFFLIFPFLYNVSVLRAGVSGLIVCTAFCRYSKKNDLSTLRYLFCVLIATLFHYSSIFFAVLIVFERIQRPREVIAISLIISAIMMAFVYSGLAFRFLGFFSAREKSLQWVSTALYPHLNIKGMLLVAVVVIGNYAISEQSFRRIQRCLAKDSPQFIVLAKRVMVANSALFITLPFALMTDVFLRYVFEFMGANIAVLSTAVSLRYKDGDLTPWSITTYTIQNLCIFLWLVFLLIYSTWPYLRTDISAFHSLYNNLLFGQKVPF